MAMLNFTGDVHARFQKIDVVSCLRPLRSPKNKFSRTLKQPQNAEGILKRKNWERNYLFELDNLRFEQRKLQDFRVSSNGNDTIVVVDENGIHRRAIVALLVLDDFFLDLEFPDRQAVVAPFDEILFVLRESEHMCLCIALPLT